ncbi:TetR/AcrR family transcriptional regulator [Nocardia colli]|uniref:TetR/AcrR family transcriptional regulator n=2 Tax=Nocardia colli TaxID=2545717 RepID=A0A5N0DX70_9NOCA|nr:TetR/AcrR family transcriptional regulator [Nocardia colli]
MRAGVVGRGRKVRVAVLAATLAELGEKGFAALTIENVARRAGVHKTTVYRRWKDPQNLIIDALTDHVASNIAIPDTGDVASDLRQLARHVVRLQNSPVDRAVTAALHSDAARLPEIAAIRSHFFGDRFRRAEPIVSRAVERGELPVGTDPTSTIKALIAPIYLRILVTAEPIDDAAADQAARIALAAARAGVFAPDGPQSFTR